MQKRKIEPKVRAKRLSVVPAALPASSIFEDGAIGPRDAARLYGGSESLYRKAMDDGRLPYTRIGMKRLIPKRALLDFFERHLVQARDSA